MPGPSAHDSDAAGARLGRMAAGIPAMPRRTIAWGQGVGMAKVAGFVLVTGLRACFYDPRSPWERPTDVNANSSVRQHFPKGTNLAKVTDEEVRGV